MVSRYYVPPIHNPPQPSPDVSTNEMYSGYPGISVSHFISSTAASCSNCRILSIDCLTYVIYVRFTHNSYYPSTKSTGVNSPFDASLPIVVWQHLPITYHNFLKSTLSLKLIAFRTCKFFSCFSGASSIQSSAMYKLHPSTSFIVSQRPLYFFNFLLKSGLVCHILLLTVVGILFESHG